MAKIKKQEILIKATVWSSIFALMNATMKCHLNVKSRSKAQLIMKSQLMILIQLIALPMVLQIKKNNFYYQLQIQTWKI